MALLVHYFALIIEYGKRELLIKQSLPLTNRVDRSNLKQLPQIGTEYLGFKLAFSDLTADFISSNFILWCRKLSFDNGIEIAG